jgi:hypothetical protein
VKVLDEINSIFNKKLKKIDWKFNKKYELISTSIT